MKQKQILMLGEQLIGLSPTVCRRAIKAIWEADARMGKEKRTEVLPKYCTILMNLLDEQTNYGFDLVSRNLFIPEQRSRLISNLGQIEIYLNIVEGKEVSEAYLAQFLPPLKDED